MLHRVLLSGVAVAAAVGVAAAQIQVRPVPVRIALPSQPSGPGTPAKAVEFTPDASASADPKSLDVPAEAAAKAKALVAQLGSTAFKDREVAARELAKLGRLALPALRDALATSPEPEVALRAEGLLPKAEAEDMKARVTCFLLDGEGKYEHTLPGWARYKAVAGNDKASRELFAEALKVKDCHAMLLAAERGAGEEAGMLLGNFIAGVSGNQQFGGNGTPRQPKTGEMLMALFLEGQFSDKKLFITLPNQWGWNNGYQTVVNNLYSNPDFSQAMSGQATKYGPVIKRVMLQWMDTRETTQGLYAAYNQANTLLRNNKEALKYAAKLVGSTGGANDYYMKQSALAALGQQGGKEYVPQIAKCFDDTNRLWWGGQGNTPDFDIEVRDYALAVALQLAEQKPEDFGLTRNGDAKTKLWNHNNFYFKDDRPAAERNPNGVAIGGGRAIVRVKGGNVEPKEEPKKDDAKKPEEKKEKLTQDDRRKVAFKKWDDWVKEHTDKDGKLVIPPPALKKDDPKKNDPVTEEKVKAAADADEKKKAEAVEAEKKAAAEKKK